jgi:hypothetical protein
MSNQVCEHGQPADRCCHCENERLNDEISTLRTERDRYLALLIAVRDHGHCVSGSACIAQNMEIDPLTETRDGLSAIQFGCKAGHRCAAEFIRNALVSRE